MILSIALHRVAHFEDFPLAGLVLLVPDFQWPASPVAEGVQSLSYLQMVAVRLALLGTAHCFDLKTLDSLELYVRLFVLL